MQTDLLALDLTCIAGDEASLAQWRTQRFVVFNQGARDAMAYGACLAGAAAAFAWGTAKGVL